MLKSLVTNLYSGISWGKKKKMTRANGFKRYWKKIYISKKKEVNINEKKYVFARNRITVLRADNCDFIGLKP